ncbi:MAG: hypothetical protein RLZZ90_356 [Actinomycetota bacterium]
MKWIVFVVVAVGIFLVFFAVYAITNLLEKKRRPKTKTLAPDDDAKFLRDLAKKLKDDEAPKPEATPAPEAEPKPEADGNEKPDDK